jgi:predicted ATPase
LLNLIPELELIVGKQPPIPELSPHDTLIRFQMVFRRFLGVFARPEHPFVLFIDDLQWLDAATLQLLEYLLVESDTRHLLLVGAYRNNEVGAEHPLTRTLNVIRQAGAPVQEIVLTALGLQDVNALVADSLRVDRRAQLAARMA